MDVRQVRGWLVGPAGRDVLLAAGIFAVVLVITIATPAFGGTGDPLTVFGFVLIALTCGVLVVRRRYPVPVALATMAGCGIYYPFVGAGSPVLVTFVVALYTVAAEGRAITATVIGGLGMIASVAGEMATPKRHIDDVALVMLTGWLVAMVALGALKHHRATVTLREREAEALRRTTEERLRIARELHDALGHNISLINVQAAAALHRLGSDPGQAAGALTAIKQASKEALRELRTTVGVLRAVDENAPTTPPPGLDGLDDLLAQARGLGLAARRDTEGLPRPVPVEVGQAAYRIVQESLTNVARHAAAGIVTVRIRYGDEDLGVEIADDGTGGPVEPGNGIRGMRERAVSLGGTLDVDGGSGGVRVRATLPIGRLP